VQLSWADTGVQKWIFEGGRFSFYNRSQRLQVRVERGGIGGGEVADDFENERGFNRGQLRFDSAGDVQAGGLPVGEGESGVGELRGERDDEEVAGKAAEADDDGGSHFAAAQVRERNGQQDQVIA